MELMITRCYHAHSRNDLLCSRTSPSPTPFSGCCFTVFVENNSCALPSQYTLTSQQLPCCKDKMAASLQRIGTVICRTFPVILQRNLQRKRICDWKITSSAAPGLRVNFCTSSSASAESTDLAETLSRYADRPWEYLESEEYIERYGSKPVWSNYRRNHKGGVPPQKTRKTCIRGDKICANACPICRDPNVIIHYKNVNLLQQFISPQTGMVYDPTRTGVCMKQQKLLNKAIDTARDHGLLSVQLPHVDYSKEDYSNTHGAVAPTPAPFSFSSGELWYSWYGNVKPDERELARVKRIYKDYLKPDV